MTPFDLKTPESFEDYFGVAVTRGPACQVVFEFADAERPFLTTDASMWAFFEPALECRLVERDASTSKSELGAVARTIGASTRTIQRRLGAERITYRKVLDATRAQLARYYLTRTQLATAEVAFLIGYDDPNSLYPAFRSWTGTTPQAIRDGARRSE